MCISGARAADAMKKTLFLANRFVLPLPTHFFFSLRTIFCRRPDDYIALYLSLSLSLPPNNSLGNYEKGPTAASSATPSHTIYTIRILIIPVPSVRNVADEYEIAGLQRPYVIRPHVGKVPRGSSTTPRGGEWVAGRGRA